MIKAMKKEKISYLKPSSRTNTNIEDIIYSEEYQNNNTNNDINTTLTNISNQLKNIAFIDKNKEQKLLNTSFRVTNRNKNVNSFFDITNIDNNTSQKFQSLKPKRVFNFFIAKNIKYENPNFEEIQKENLELKENIKFLLKQIKKYQKSGLTIEDMNVNREQKMEKLEKEISELKKELNSYRNQIMILNTNNQKLNDENQELKEYINNINELKESQNQFIEKKIDLRENNISNYKEPNNNFVYKSKKKNLNNEKNENEEENNMNSNSKLSEELLYEINKELLHGKMVENKNKSYFSEGKLYQRKNVIKNISFNYEPNYMNKRNENYKINKKYTYSKNITKNKSQN
jgi:hypothetical protein